MGKKPTQKLTCTDEERDKAIRLVSQLVRWANTKDDYQSDLDNLTDADFLTKQEVIRLENLAQTGTTGTVTWQGKDKGAPELLVKTNKRAFLEALCCLSDYDVRTHLNGYLRVQKARNTNQKTFLGILTDNRPLNNDGRTREPPDFTLKLWSRKVARNKTELIESWDEKRREWIEKGWLSERREMNTQPESNHDVQDGASATPFAEPPTIDMSSTPQSPGIIVPHKAQQSYTEPLMPDKQGNANEAKGTQALERASLAAELEARQRDFMAVDGQYRREMNPARKNSLADQRQELLDDIRRIETQLNSLR